MNTKDFWNNRYKNGGNSGSGSYGELYTFKTTIINDIIKKYNINNIIDFGSGDGNQIKELNINSYIGLDISEEAINICKQKYKDDKSKSFFVNNDFNYSSKADMCISLDVLYHILEEDSFMDYLKKLFNSSKKIVLIYSNNYEGHIHYHIHTRKFTDYIDKYINNWKLLNIIKQQFPDKSSADFYIFEYKDN